jgi:hypothetical protein
VTIYGTFFPHCEISALFGRGTHCALLNAQSIYQLNGAITMATLAEATEDAMFLKECVVRISVPHKNMTEYFSCKKTRARREVFIPYGYSGTFDIVADFTAEPSK